jgi:hypothetical protein
VLGEIWYSFGSEVKVVMSVFQHGLTKFKVITKVHVHFRVIYMRTKDTVALQKTFWRKNQSPYILLRIVALGVEGYDKIVPPEQLTKKQLNIPQTQNTSNNLVYNKLSLNSAKSDKNFLEPTETT